MIRGTTPTDIKEITDSKPYHIVKPRKCITDSQVLNAM